MGRRQELPSLHGDCWSASCPALCFPLICTQVDLQSTAELLFTLSNCVLAVPSVCPFTVLIRGFYRKVRITREEAKKTPKSENKAKQRGVKHKLARAKGWALILLLTFVFIQRLWIQVSFLCSIFIAKLLVLTRTMSTLLTGLRDCPILFGPLHLCLYLQVLSSLF